MILKFALAVTIVLAALTAADAAGVKKNARNPLWGTTVESQTAPRAAHSRKPSVDVYDHRGQYVGSDPDGRVRLELLRDRGAEE